MPKTFISFKDRAKLFEFLNANMNRIKEEGLSMTDISIEMENEGLIPELVKTRGVRFVSNLCQQFEIKWPHEGSKRTVKVQIPFFRLQEIENSLKIIAFGLFRIYKELNIKPEEDVLKFLTKHIGNSRGGNLHLEIESNLQKEPSK